MLKELLSKLSAKFDNSKTREQPLMPRPDFTFLTKEQIWGDNYGNGQLDVMKKYGTAVAATDLAILLGCAVSNKSRSSDEYRTPENDLTCPSWSVSSYNSDYVRCVTFYGDERMHPPYMRLVSARPALPPAETEKLQPKATKIGVNGVDIVEYGEYPQTVVDEEEAQELERLFQSGSLKPTGKTYVFDQVGLSDYDTSFQAKVYSEYEGNAKKYIRIFGRPYDNDSKLSDGQWVRWDIPYWVEVQPVEWLMDKSGWMVSKKCLFSGIQFDTNKTYDGNFSKTSIKQYLDTYFSKEIEPSELEEDKARKATIKSLNTQLAEVMDLEKTKTQVTPARTPERTEQLARIVRVRRAKKILSRAAQKAQKEGNQEMLQEIMELAKPFAARQVAIQNKFNLKRAERRTARAKKDRE